MNTIIHTAQLGRFCSISRNVDIGANEHDYRKITTLPAENLLLMAYLCGEDFQSISPMIPPCIIGNDVCIGTGVSILSGITVGDGAVIGAGAVVNRDIPPYAIAAGVPVRVIKHRCAENFREMLQAIKWWDWPEKYIKDNITYFLSHNISDESIKKLQEIQASISGE